MTLIDLDESNSDAVLKTLSSLVNCYLYPSYLNHPQVSGNKLHKLIPNIDLANENDCVAVLSFGGAYSNHLHALAYACKEIGLPSIGLIRGELHESLTPTLKDCREWGMELIPMSRKTYRDVLLTLEESGGGKLSEVLPDLEIVHGAGLRPNTWVIPEGGSNIQAINSIANAYRSLFKERNYTHAICATGTGATLAGLRKAAPSSVRVIGIQTVAEGDATIQRIQAWLGNELESNLGKLEIIEGHLGGFAKMPKDLIEFIDKFEEQEGIPLDPVYNGKMLYKFMQMQGSDYFSQSDKVLLIHTGGLQGNRSF